MRPRMIVVAGPPGSGKTTALPGRAFGVDSFNIDDRCAELTGSYVGIDVALRARVARECESFVESHIANRPNSPDIAYERVLARAIGGGHGARAEILRSTYEASLENLLVAIRAFESVICLDSSRHGIAPYVSATARAGVLSVHEGATSEWLEAVRLTRGRDH